MPLPALIPRSVLFGNPSHMSPQVSPDGKRLAFIAPDNGVLNVWVREEDGEERPVTADNLRGIRSFTWSPEGSGILYRQDVGGDENWHIYHASIQSNETRDLTPFDGIAAQILEADPRFPSEILVAVNHRMKELYDVYRINLESGEAVLDTMNPGNVSSWPGKVTSWFADSSLKIRACIANFPDASEELRVREGEDGEWKTIIHSEPDEFLGSFVQYSLDNSRISFISSKDANAARLVEYALATGASRVLAQDGQFDVSGVLTHPTTNAIEAVQFVKERSEWSVLDESVREDFAALERTQRGDIAILSRDVADRNWTVGFVVDNGPVYYYHYNRKNREAHLLFSNRPELENYELTRMQPMSFAARDGMKIYGYLTLPLGKERSNLPLIVLVHGGPWARDIWGYSSMVQWLANRGYAVLQVNYRGSTGYGKAYVNAGDREWAGKMQTDLLDGKEWALKQGFANASKVAIMGGSYGGYAALVGVSFTPGEFCCGVDIVGPSNLITLIQSIPPYWKPVRSVFDKRMGNADTEPEFLTERSPLFRAHEIRAPLLIAQGANDPRVKMAESDQMAQAMRENGIPVEYIVFPDEGHGFARPENNMRFYAAAEAFLAKHLGGRMEPASPEESIEPFRK